MSFLLGFYGALPTLPRMTIVPLDPGDSVASSPAHCFRTPIHCEMLHPLREGRVRARNLGSVRMQIDAGWARKAVELLGAQRLPVELLLAQAGLDAATVNRKGAQIPFAAHVAVLEHAAAAARDPCFGLHLGAALNARDLGLVGYLGQNAVTLGEALHGGARYLRLFTEGTRVEIEVKGEQVRISQHIVDPAGAGSRQIADLGASYLVRYCRILTGTMLAPAWVELPYASGDERRAPARARGTGPVRAAPHRGRAGAAATCAARRWRRPRSVRHPGAGLS